jgi:hypothetical protein
MRILILGTTFIGLAATISAETVTLRSGAVIGGTYLGGSSREVKLAVDDQIRTLNVADISRIDFNATPGPARREVTREERAGIMLPAGTNLVVRMIDGVDSERNSVGQTFSASMDEPVMLNGDVVIPRGADAVVKLVDAAESGKLTGRSTLTLDLLSIKVNERMVDVNTETIKEESSSGGARTAKAVGGGAALGTIIGAIAGHGKGAAIGAGAGAAAGVGAEILTKGQHVKIPSETRLTFALENAVRLH